MTAATATASSSGVRYAPEDPTLPKPWRGLVDSKTGYLYFWNPETNVTQYQRPVASSHASSASPNESISSSVQIERSSQGECNDNSSPNDDDKCNRGSNGGSMRDNSVAASFETNRNASDNSLGAAAKGYVSSGSGSGLCADSYCRQHEITVIGDNVPQPFTSFEATGYPSEILRECSNCWRSTIEPQESFIFASYTFSRRCDIFSKEELNVVHCAAPFWVLASIWSALICWTSLCGGLPESSKFKAGTDVGDDSACHLVRTEEEASPVACFSKHLVYNAGFSAPSPIQAQSWPIALQGRDIVAVAKTGSGKTLGYLLPGFIHLKHRRNNPRLGPTVLVLSPTRELATQIQDEALKFGKSSRISCTCLYGGAPKGPQLKELDRGVDVVVATPGRLNDILEMRRVSLHQVSYLVLDEADRMLDMGFEPQIRKIVKEVPTRRQTLMYTATWPKEVRKIAADLLNNPIQVNIGNVDELVANKSITQYVELLSPMDKQGRLEQILRSQEPGSKIIIFCSTKKMCDQLARNLNRNFGAASIHGDKSQSERDSVLNEFRTGRSPVLVATDVAARGLDIKDIRVVVNYDFPTGIEDYVHRIGRTGRAGATGEAYTFFSDRDSKHASDLVKVLEGASQHVPAELRGMTSYGGGMGRPKRQWDSGPGEHDGGRGGHYDSGYSGRDGGRGSWGMSSSDTGGGRDNNRDSRDSGSYGQSSYNGNDAGASGSYHYRSFHDSMMQTTEKRSRSRSRSRSPNKGVGCSNSWSRGRSRSRSRSVDRSDQSSAPERPRVRSFHESMMERA